MLLPRVVGLHPGVITGHAFPTSPLGYLPIPQPGPRYPVLQLHSPPRPIARTWHWATKSVSVQATSATVWVGSFLMQALGDECLGGHLCSFLVNADSPWPCEHVLSPEKGSSKRREHGVWEKRSQDPGSMLSSHLRQNSLDWPPLPHCCCKEQRHRVHAFNLSTWRQGRWVFVSSRAASST